MRYQVPQFVDIEDKIIGPFTLKQFLIYLGAVFLLIPIYLFSDLSLFITIALPVLAVAGAFAHLKINGKPLAGVLTNGIFYLTKGQVYVWRRVPHAKPLVLRDSHWEELVSQTRSGGEDMPSLTRMSQVLETEGNVVKSEDVEDTLAVEES
jgi:hypothetical protein